MLRLGKSIEVVDANAAVLSDFASGESSLFERFDDGRARDSERLGRFLGGEFVVRISVEDEVGVRR